MVAIFPGHSTVFLCCGTNIFNLIFNCSKNASSVWGNDSHTLDVRTKLDLDFSKSFKFPGYNLFILSSFFYLHGSVIHRKGLALRRSKVSFSNFITISSKLLLQNAEASTKWQTNQPGQKVDDRNELAWDSDTDRLFFV